MVVYVISKSGKPLMPCQPVTARLLLAQGKAKCIIRTPFTIKLLYITTEYVQELELSLDTGSSKLGTAVADEENNILYVSEVELRNDITGKMKQRSRYRRNRRTRNTRYRPCRFLNRGNSTKEGRLSPTIISKVYSHVREIKFILSILPISKIIMETASFDVTALDNPEVLVNKILYQRGINFEYANTKAFVLARDNYTCQNCKGKSKDKRKHVHHIIFRENLGSDEHENLLTLCKTCHNLVHDGKLIIKKQGKIKGQLKHATQMNSIRIQLKKIFPEAEETFGFITKEYRQLLGLPKEHYMDAVAIVSRGNPVNFKANTILYKKCVSDGDYQKTKGIRSEKKITTGKVQGFRKFDKVKYLGKEYFIKGKMKSGYAKLMDVFGSEIKFSPMAKFDKMKRIGARKSWIMKEEIIVDIRA